MIGGSRFAHRFAYARLVQPVDTRAETDAAFGKAVGVGSSSITAYHKAANPPPAPRVLAIAKRCKLDPGWLAFGTESAAPVPEGFVEWLEKTQPKPTEKLAPRRRKPKKTTTAKRAASPGRLGT